MGQSRPLLCLFSSFQQVTIQILFDKSVGMCCAWDSNLGGRMEGTDESKELLQHHTIKRLLIGKFCLFNNSLILDIK